MTLESTLELIYYPPTPSRHPLGKAPRPSYAAVRLADSQQLAQRIAVSQPRRIAVSQSQKLTERIVAEAKRLVVGGGVCGRCACSCSSCCHLV